MKFLLVLVMAGILFIEFCHCSYWDHNHKPGMAHSRVQRMSRDRPRPLRHHRHIQAHNSYHRPHSRMHRPPPPPGHRRRNRPPPPPHRHASVKSYMPPMSPIMKNQGQMFIQPMGHNHIAQASHPPRRYEHAPPYFQQDEIIHEQSKHYPITTVPNQQRQPHTSPNYQSVTESQPHGYLSSTYKGWKPIVKPYQNSYLRAPKLNNNNKDYHPHKDFDNNGHPNSLHTAQSNNINVHQHLNFNTLFREQTEHMKPSNTLKTDYSENQGVMVPLPSAVSQQQQGRFQQSMFMDSPWKNQFHGVMASQSEEVPIIKKPSFTKFKSILNSSPPPSPPPTSENPEGLSKFPKFKFRPRPRPLSPKEGGIPQEITSLPKAPSFNNEQSSDEISQTQPPLKGKFNNRGRVRVRTKVVKQFTGDSAEDGLPVPKPLQPFESTRGGQQSSVENVNIDNSDGERQPPGPPYHPPRDQPPRGRVPSTRLPINIEIQNDNERPRGPPISRPQNRGPNNHVRNHSDETFSSPPLHNGDHRISHPTSNFYQRPESHYNTGNLQETTEPEPKFSHGNQQQHIQIQPQEHQQQQQQHHVGERRKKQKVNNKNKVIESQQQEEQQQQPPPVNNETPAFLDDFYFPPGFSPDPSKNTGQHPVSFMTMPGSKPQVIHHTYDNHRQQNQQQQQLYPINVIRSPSSDLEYQRPNQGHGGANTNGPSYVPNNRPRFVLINNQNGAGQSRQRERDGPPGFHNQHNPAAAYPSNNHESTYSPHAFGSNISPFTYGSPYPPGGGRHSQMTFPPPSHAAGPHYVPQRASSATMRNPYPFQSSNNAHTFSVPYETSPTVNSFEMRDSSEASSFPSSQGFIPATSPSSFLSTSPRTMHSPPPSPPHMNPHFHKPNSHPNSHQRYPEYSPPSYGSAEYDKIPMQFMDQLRPILKDEPIQSPSTTPNNRHQSPEIHPPAGFFDDFFRPFDDGYNANPDQDLDPKASSPIQNQIRGPLSNYHDTYKAQSSPQASVVPHPVTNSFGTSTKAYSGFSPQVHETSPSSSIGSSTQKSAYNDVNSYTQKSWSKLREEDIGVSSTEIIPHSTTTQGQKKTGNKVNQSKQQSSLVHQSRQESNTKSKSRDTYNGIEEDTKKISATTYKPSDPLRLRKVDGNFVNEESNPMSDHVVSDVESILPLDDDFNDDSNTPRSVVRVRGTTESATQRTTTEDPEVSTTTFKSRRQFRRRRPDSAVRRRYFSSRVKPLDLDEKETTTTVKSHHEKDDEFEPSRISVLKHRRLFHRRRNPSSSNRVKGSSAADVEEEKFTSTSTVASPPSSTESESVTYGESQWFRIKPTDSTEQEVFHVGGGNKQTTHPKISTLKPQIEKDQYKSKVGSTTSGVELLPLESTTEVSAEEVIKPSYSSKHSISFKEERRFPSHKRDSSP